MGIRGTVDWMQARQVTESAPPVRSWRRNLFKALRQGSCGSSEIWKQISSTRRAGTLIDGSLSQELREDGRGEEVSGRVGGLNSTGEVAGVGGGTESSNSRDANGRIDGWIENMAKKTLENEGAAQAVAEWVQAEVQVSCGGPREVVSNQRLVTQALVGERANVLDAVTNQSNGNARMRDKQRRKRQRLTYYGVSGHTSNCGVTGVRRRPKKHSPVRQ